MKKILVVISILTFILTGCSNEYISEDTAKGKSENQNAYEENNVSFNSSLEFVNGLYQSPEYSINVLYVSYEDYSASTEEEVKNFSEFTDVIDSDITELEKQLAESELEDASLVAKFEKVRNTDVINIIMSDNASYTTVIYYLPSEDGIIMIYSNISGENDIPNKELNEILNSVYVKEAETTED
ncbi:MAG: membrane lipoprotein lipid attachment site-containing protein [Bacilli bacterium]